jgi:aldehyde:ferredoxin oxidoreductase
MDRLLAEYYAVRDWDWESGKPSPQKLVSLGLPEIADELWGSQAGPGKEPVF